MIVDASRPLVHSRLGDLPFPPFQVGTSLSLCMQRLNVAQMAHGIAKGNLRMTRLQEIVQQNPTESSRSRVLQDASDSGEELVERRASAPPEGGDDGDVTILVIVAVVGLGLLVCLAVFLCFLARRQRNRARQKRHQNIQRQARLPVPPISVLCCA